MSILNRVVDRSESEKGISVGRSKQQAKFEPPVCIVQCQIETRWFV